MSLPIVLVPHPHVRVDAAVLGGSPHVADTRVPVRRLWAFYLRGASIPTLCKRFPALKPAEILDALAFAYDNEEVVEADLAREEALVRRAGGEPGAATAPRAKALRPVEQQRELPFSRVVGES